MNSARRLDFRLYGIRPPQLAAARSSDEQTEDALYADTRNFFKVEIWTADDLHSLRTCLRP